MLASHRFKRHNILGQALEQGEILRARMRRFAPACKQARRSWIGRDLEHKPVLPSVLGREFPPRDKLGKIGHTLPPDEQPRRFLNGRNLDHRSMLPLVVLGGEFPRRDKFDKIGHTLPPDEQAKSFSSSMDPGVNHRVIEEAVPTVPSQSTSMKDLTSRLRACTSLSEGKMLHAWANKLRYGQNPFIATSLVAMYARHGDFAQAVRMFELVRGRVEAWNALMLGYVKSGENEAAFDLWTQMQQAPDVCNFRDERTFVAVLQACTGIAMKEAGKIDGQGKLTKPLALEKGREVHSKYEGRQNVYTTSTLIGMYGKCGSVVEARAVFDKAREKNNACWNALISAYLDAKHYTGALDVFTGMLAACGANDRTYMLLVEGLAQAETFEHIVIRLFSRLLELQPYPAPQAYVAVLLACGRLAALETGKRIHAMILENGNMADNRFIATSLVDFYGKCGEVDSAKQAFDEMPQNVRDTAAWNALIAAYASNPPTELPAWIETVPEPNDVTWTIALKLCSHAGLVADGKRIFKRMDAPTYPAYVCLIDLLARSGNLREALRVLEGMPFHADDVAWRALLAGAHKWKSVKYGEMAFRQLLVEDLHDDGKYHLMKNIYAARRMHKKKQGVLQQLADAEGLQRLTATSWWVDSKGVKHEFVAGGTNSHPEIDSVREKLAEIMERLEKEEPALFESEADMTCTHCERLAVAHALLKSTTGSTIRIIKNLRICEECHKVLTALAKKEGVRIVCRDFSRFHVFSGGGCSCRGIW